MKFLFVFLFFISSLVNAEISASSYAVIDQDGNVLFEKNSDEIRSIASITKLFSLSQITPDLNTVSISKDEKDRIKNTRMRLRIGVYDEIQLLGAALSASNNEAAKSLGKAHWVAFELAKKKYPDVLIVEPSGLDPNNRSSALALAKGALQISNTSIAQYTLKKTILVNNINFNNTNPLLQKFGWNFKLSKTGFINESGGCLLVVFTVSGRDYSVAILGSTNTKQRWADLSQLRYLISNEPYFVYNSIQKKSKHK